MATTGRLIRTFPGPALEVADTVEASDFQVQVAKFLADMDFADPEGSAPTTKKAGSDVVEVRDTADPHYITCLFTSILHGLPESKPAEIERIEKR
ncbi:hypothetical protein C0991_004256, partial [Blastosporella zonata]